MLTRAAPRLGAANLIFNRKLAASSSPRTSSWSWWRLQMWRVGPTQPLVFRLLALVVQTANHFRQRQWRQQEANRWRRTRGAGSVPSASSGTGRVGRIMMNELSSASGGATCRPRTELGPRAGPSALGAQRGRQWGQGARRAAHRPPAAMVRRAEVGAPTLSWRPPLGPADDCLCQAELEADRLICGRRVAPAAAVIFCGPELAKQSASKTLPRPKLELGRPLSRPQIDRSAGQVFAPCAKLKFICAPLPAQRLRGRPQTMAA